MVFVVISKYESIFFINFEFYFSFINFRLYFINNSKTNIYFVLILFLERMKMKRENNHDDGPHSDKRSRRNDDQVRILIPSNVS